MCSFGSAGTVKKQDIHEDIHTLISSKGRTTKFCNTLRSKKDTTKQHPKGVQCRKTSNISRNKTIGSNSKGTSSMVQKNVAISAGGSNKRKVMEMWMKTLRRTKEE